MLRTCLRNPIPEIYQCADLIRSAVTAHMSNASAEAAALLAHANDPIVREWLNSVWGKNSPYVQFRSIPNAPPVIKKSDRIETRMPTNEEKAEIHRRDGFNCRFCGIPLIRREVRQVLHALYPEQLPWGRTNATQHAAFQALWLQYDHILPHSRGGTSTLGNVVITCAACNFGRMEFTIEEVGLEDPRIRPPQQSGWNGMEHLLPVNKQIPLTAKLAC